MAIESKWSSEKIKRCILSSWGTTGQAKYNSDAGRQYRHYKSLKSIAS